MMELLTGGELLDAVLEKGSYSEADARLCFIQLLRGMAYLHSQCDSDLPSTRRMSGVLHGHDSYRTCVGSLQALCLLHSCRGVAHRDLKLENLLLASPDDITDIKVQLLTQAALCLRLWLTLRIAMVFCWPCAFAKHVDTWSCRLPTLGWLRRRRLAAQ